MDGKDRFQRIEAIFRDACAMDAAGRDSFVREAAGGDRNLADEVFALLQADRSQGGALDLPILQGPLDFGLGDESPVHTPEHIGPYRILGVIGEGGMGVVYEAEQENPRRRVAIKVLRPGLSTAALRRRFDLEAQILGRLQHEGIARIHEAGSTRDASGREQPFVVMELVRGQALLEFADQRMLSTRARLELMAMVCDAVHYAHQNGVVHRDLKPGNILVTEDGSTAAGQAPAAKDALPGVQPKILDFGVARITESDVQAVTIQTTVGELIGTVPYMSPEQAAGDPSRIDWRSDVYSLGVILFELLTQRLPHDLRGRAVHEAVRVIREDEPARAGSIDRALRGDIETILAKALDKDMRQRYQSAADLARDIRHHLRDEPITARQHTAFYQLRKFAQRHRAVVGGVALAFAAMLIGTIVSVRQMMIAREALRTSEIEFYRACLLGASAAVFHHDAAGAQRHLNAAPEHLRGWEWRHLSGRVDDRLASATAGFAPMFLDLSADDSLVASGSSSGNIHVWSTPDLTPAGSVRIAGSVQARRPFQVEFTDENRSLRADTIVGSIVIQRADGTEISRDQHAARARSHTGDVAAWSQARNHAESLIVGRIADDSELFRIDALSVGQSRFGFSDDDALFAIAIPDERGTSLYRIADGVRLWTRPDLARAIDLEFSRDSSALATIDSRGNIRVLRATDGGDLAMLPAPASPVTAIELFDGASFLASGSVDGTICIWSVADEQCVAVMHGASGQPYELLATADGQRLISIGAAGGLSLWDATLRSDPFVLAVAGPVYDVEISPDGATLAVACLLGEPSLRLFDLPSGRERSAIDAGNLSAISFSRGGDRLALGRSSGRTSLVTADAGAELLHVAGHDWRTDWVAMSRDETMLYSVGNSGRLWGHEIAGGRCTLQRQFKGNLSGAGCRAALSPDGSTIAVAGSSIISLVDAATFEIKQELKGHTAAISAIAFDATGTRLASAGRDRAVRLWDARRGELLATMEGHTEEVFAVMFSPDGGRLVSGGRDRVIRVWDPVRFEEITQLQGHASYVYCLAFTRDGETLISGGGDATVRLWTIQPWRTQRCLPGRRGVEGGGEETERLRD